MRFDYPYMVVAWLPGQPETEEREGFIHRDDALEFASRCAESCGMDALVLSMEASFMAAFDEDSENARGTNAKTAGRGVRPGLDYPATLAGPMTFLKIDRAC